MYSNKEVKEYLSSYRGMKKIAAQLCIKLSAPLIRILNQEFSLIKSVAERHEDMLKNSSQIEADNRALLESLGKSCGEMSVNIRKLNSRLEGYEELAEKVGRLSSRLEGYEELAQIVKGLSGCRESFADLTSRMDRLESLGDMLTVKIAGLEKGRVPVPKKQTDTPEKTEPQESSISCRQQDEYSSIDYFDFENHFRGSRNAVKQSQRMYIDYFRNRKHVLDVG